MEENSKLELVLEEYRELVWHIIYRHIKKSKLPRDHDQDMYQEVCIRIMGKLEEFDESVASMRTFLIAIIDTTCMRYVQHYYKHDNEELDEEKACIDTSYEFNVHDMIERFPVSPRYRKVIYKTMEGYKQQEIAKELKLSQSTVSRVLSDFKDYLLETTKE